MRDLVRATARLLFRPHRGMVEIMSKKAEAVLEQIQALPLSEQRALWEVLGQRIGQISPLPAGKLYGEPLEDEDIEQSARVTFQMLDEEERAKPR